jgi:hypothetical protein
VSVHNGTGSPSREDRGGRTSQWRRNIIGESDNETRQARRDLTSLFVGWIASRLDDTDSIFECVPPLPYAFGRWALIQVLTSVMTASLIRESAERKCFFRFRLEQSSRRESRSFSTTDNITASAVSDVERLLLTLMDGPLHLGARRRSQFRPGGRGTSDVRRSFRPR